MKNCDYVRVYVTLTQAEDKISSLDEIFIDGYHRTLGLPSLVGCLSGSSSIIDENKRRCKQIFDEFANNKNGTMSRDDLTDFMVQYNVGSSNINVVDKVDEIFLYYCHSKSKLQSQCNGLTLDEFLKFYCYSHLTDRNATVYYPDYVFDGDLSIIIKKDKKSGRYYGDFPTVPLFKRLEDLRDITVRVRGKYKNGSVFEYSEMIEEKQALTLDGYANEFCYYDDDSWECLSVTSSDSGEMNNELQYESGMVDDWTLLCDSC